MQDDLEAFLAQPLVARVAASGPTVRPVWFLWEDGCFWWLTGSWSILARRLQEDPRVALVVDSCDVSDGRVLQVTVSGAADVQPLDRDRAVRKLSRYLGTDPATWPGRFQDPLDDSETRMVRLRPKHGPVLKDLSFSWADGSRGPCGLRPVGGAKLSGPHRSGLHGASGQPVLTPPHGGGEREMLLASLQRQRDLVVWKVAGLPDDRARVVATPTGLTVHGVVLHLLDVERSWVRRWFAGQPGLAVLGVDANHVGGLAGAQYPPLVELVSAYQAESGRCDEVLVAHGLDQLEAAGPRTLRWVLHHLVEETSRHLGHLDVLCELADGRTGEQPLGPEEHA